jgi:hypothetical protein
MDSAIQFVGVFVPVDDFGLELVDDFEQNGSSFQVIN